MKCSGIDAPESAMPYGKEAKEALLKLVEGKCLTVHIYDTDRYGRSVGDLHAGGVFVQVRNYIMCIIFRRTACLVEAT
jgi:endonuclease YncB( thermonuclease family)